MSGRITMDWTQINSPLPTIPSAEAVVRQTIDMTREDLHETFSDLATSAMKLAEMTPLRDSTDAAIVGDAVSQAQMAPECGRRH